MKKFYVFAFNYDGLSVKQMKEAVKNNAVPEEDVFDDLDEAVAHLHHMGEHELAYDEEGLVFDGEEVVYRLW